MLTIWKGRPMSNTDPPYRADHVGSLLRPPAIHGARARFRSGELDAAGLRAIEDEAVDSMIPKLADTGIRSITDGEFRREWFHLDFLRQLGGITVEGMIASTSGSEETVHQAPPRITVTGPLTHDHAIQVADYRFVAARTPGECSTKVAIPSPTMAHFRGGRAGIDVEAYPDLDPFFDDLAQVYRDEIAALHAAGGRMNTMLGCWARRSRRSKVASWPPVPTVAAGPTPSDRTGRETRTRSRSVRRCIGLLRHFDAKVSGWPV